MEESFFIAMNKNILKNIIICVLVAACLYQMNGFWFGGSPGHSLFGFLAVRNGQPNGAEAAGMLVTPSRIAVSVGEDKYSIRYNNLAASRIKLEIDSVLTELFQSGEFVRSGTVDWNGILSRMVIIYEYKFMMPSGVFADYWGPRTSLLTSRTDSFDRVIIIPGEDGGEVTAVIFTGNGLYCEYEIKGSGVNERLNDAMKNERARFFDIYYVSSRQKGYTAEENLFIAESKKEIYYDNVMNINPYMTDGSVLPGQVEKKVDFLFDNPERKWTGVQNSFSYTDEDTVVRYYPSRVLEYLNYKIPERSANTMESAFAAAVGIIGRDPEVRNEYYLAEYRKDGEEWTFSFDYAINDFPLLLPMNLREAAVLDMEHSMEVTVEDGKVSKYRRYVCYFENEDPNTVKDEEDEVEINFVKTAENEFGFAEGEDNDIKNIELAYKIEEDNLLYLYWFIETGENSFVCPVRQFFEVPQ